MTELSAGYDYEAYSKKIYVEEAAYQIVGEQRGDVIVDIDRLAASNKNRAVIENEDTSESETRASDLLIKKAQRGSEKSASAGQKKHLQLWYGSVNSIDGDFLQARLIDPSGTHPDMDAEIPVEQIDEGEKQFLQIGAVFYLNVSLLVSPHGKKSVSSTIRFKRIRKFDVLDQKLTEKYVEMFEGIA